MLKVTPLPVGRAAQRCLHGHRPAQDARQHGKSFHTGCGERLHHLVGRPTVDDRGLQRVAVHEHRRVQSPEAADAQGVEDLGTDDTEVVPAGGDALDDLLLGVGIEVADLVVDLDLQASLGQLCHGVDEGT